ncbi:hypothetical protein D3C87_2070810 [compost metagenome]
MTVLLPTIKPLPPVTVTLAASYADPVTVTAVVAFETFTVYSKVPGAKFATVFPSTCKSLKLESLLFALTTVTV